MLALLIPLDGFLIYLAWRCLLPGRDWRESVLAVYVTMGVLITISVEILGAFHTITATAIRCLWLSILVICLLLLYWQRNRIFNRRFSLKIGGRFEWLVLLLISAYFLVTLFIALYAPPNTNDSLQYHMSRVMHWIVDRSVNFYATPIDRQLWMPPFAEYAILHLFLLAGSDRFVNLVQWFSMAGSAIAVALIAAKIGVKPRGQWFAAFFTLTLPMGILQATSTQTDYVVGFWSLSIFYYILSECQRFIQAGKVEASHNTVLLGLSLSLGLLTKETIVASVFPILLYFLIVLVRRHLWKVIAGTAMLGGVFILVLNAPFWMRDYSTYKSILGPGVGSLGSSSYDPRLVFSAALKTATNQLALPADQVNKDMMQVVEKIDEIMGINLNDPRTSLSDYQIRFSIHEDFAGNPGQFLFWIFSTLFISILFILTLLSPYFPQGSKLGKMIEIFPQPIDRAFSYVLVSIAGYFLFALLFKWQLNNSRLLLPWMITIGPLAGWVSDVIRPRILLFTLTSLLAIGGLPYLLANPSRPLVNVGKNESILLASRTQVLFYNSPVIANDYTSVISAAKDDDCGSIGLELDSSTPEYLIWYLLSRNSEPADHVENISATPETMKLIDPAFRPCIVLCNICSVAEVKGYQQVYNRGSLQLYVRPH